jgi:hypothetical protein
MDDRKPTSLDELWAQSAEQIMNRLVIELKEEGGPTYQRMPIQVLETRVQRLFDAFWQSVSQQNATPLKEYVWTTGRERGHEGFSVAELHNVALRLRDALFDAVDEAFPDEPALRLRYSRTVEDLIFAGISTGVQGFVDGREALISRQYEALRRREDEGQEPSQPPPESTPGESNP